jgi:hypothetical protein
MQLGLAVRLAVAMAAIHGSVAWGRILSQILQLTCS